MLLEIILASLGGSGYLGAGIITARMEYAQHVAAWSRSEDKSPVSSKELMIKRRKMQHYTMCNLRRQNASVRARGCNCNRKSEWSYIKDRLDDIKGGKIIEKPDPEYFTVFTWPFYFIGQFIKSGANRIHPHDNVVEGEVLDSYDSPVLDKVNRLVAETERANRIANDPLYKQMKEELDKIESAYEIDLEAAEKAIRERAKANVARELVEKKVSPKALASKPVEYDKKPEGAFQQLQKEYQRRVARKGDNLIMEDIIMERDVSYELVYDANMLCWGVWKMAITPDGTRKSIQRVQLFTDEQDYYESRWYPLVEKSKTLKYKEQMRKADRTFNKYANVRQAPRITMSTGPK